MSPQIILAEKVSAKSWRKVVCHQRAHKGSIDATFCMGWEAQGKLRSPSSLLKITARSKSLIVMDFLRASSD